jgi:molecular chaperone GrpE
MTWQETEADIIALLRQTSALQTRLMEREEEAAKEKKAMLLQIAGVLDAFDRVFNNIAPKEKDADRLTKIWLGNFRSIRRLVDSTLKEAGVVKIESPTGKAIPGFHTVVETVENAELENDTIVEELERGYLWGEQVLRKASVKVVKNRGAMNGESNRL